MIANQNDKDGKKQAVSYIRYSCLLQGREGKDSTKRQQDALRDAMEKWNLTLSESHIDKGKSGYHQKHLKAGAAMHDLRRRAVAGELAGKVVVLEDWDRGGRMETCDAAPLILDMLNNGVDLVVGAYGGEYFSREKVNANPYLLYGALDSMRRGYEESKRKTDMKIHEWKAKRDAIKAGKFTPLRCLPAWIDNGPLGFVIDEKKAATVRLIFKLYLEGLGCNAITAKFNRENVPLLTAGRKNATRWNPTLIQRLIPNKAVIGYYCPRNDGLRQTMEQAGVFKPIVDEKTFYAANAKLAERLKIVGNMGGRAADEVSLFASVITCHKCGATLFRHTKGGVTRLICSNSRKGECQYAGISNTALESLFATLLVNQRKQFQSVKQDTSELDAINGKIAEVERQIEKLTALIVQMDTPTVALGNQLAKFEANKNALVVERETATVALKGSTPLDNSFIDRMAKLAQNKLTDKAARMELKQGIKASVDKMIAYPLTNRVFVQFKGQAWGNMLDLARNVITMELPDAVKAGVEAARKAKV